MNIRERLQNYWPEKYRPVKIDDMILDPKDKKLMEGFIEKKDIPNLIFLGKPGTGKSTLARILTISLTDHKDDRLVFNGSDERGIDVIRNKLIPFMSVPPFKSNIKIAMIDEADGLTPEAFSALRSAIEDPTVNSFLKTRFILTANYANKIPQAIMSRMQTISYNTPSEEMIAQRCKIILDFENVTYEDETVDEVVAANYPDIRAIIGSMEMSIINNKLETRYSLVELDVIKEIIRNLLASQNFDDASRYRGELIDKFSSEYDALDLISWILDEFIDDPLVHSLAFRYSTLANNCVDTKHLIIALFSDVLLARFSM